MPSTIDNISAIDAASRLRDTPNGVVLLDCREPKEQRLCAIDGALLIPMGDIPARRAELDEVRDREIIVMCHHGRRSVRVARWLIDQGFPNISNLAGGIDAWSREVDASVPRY